MSSQSRQRPPFRAEHLGSLLRPDELLQVQERIADRQADQKELTTVEDSAIKDIVQTQQQIGFHAITDGEYRRLVFWGTFFEDLEGFEEVPNSTGDAFRLYVPDVAAFTQGGKHQPKTFVLCTGKIKHVGSSYVDQWNYLKTLVPKERRHEIKISLASPTWYHLRYRPGRAYPTSVYPSDVEYFAALAQAYQTEIQILYDNGLRNIQFDDPNLAYFCSPQMRAGFKEHGEDVDALFDSYIALYNDCLKERPADLHVGVHICRGNFAGGRHFSEGGYDAIAVRLFRDLNVDTFYLEYDTPRAGGFEPLKQLPRNKNVILGLISSKFPKLESLQELRARVYQAADLIAEGNGSSREEALKQIGVSPQCGFASHPSGNIIDKDQMVEKLRLVRNLADTIWPGEP